MSMINLFLQKRKMHESQYGIVMVIIAYVLSVLMLFLGSDVFYNVNTAAAGISKATNEETQETIFEEQPDTQIADQSAILVRSKIQNPYGIAEISETGLGNTHAEKLSTVAQSTNDFMAGDTVWLLGNAMNSEEYESLIGQLTSLESVSSVVQTQETALGVEEESKDNTEIFSLSTEETAGSSVGNVTKDEIKMLERIVQSEAGGEDMVGKVLIVNVVLNRVEAEEFPDSIEDVIFQNKHGEYQFSPVEDERYWSVKISDDTKAAVMKAIEGEDYSEGALYFIARKRTKASSAKWFDQNLDWLFKHGGHEFFKNK